MPTGKAVVTSVAESPETVPLPSSVEPSKNSTVPLGATGPVVVGVMAAVRVASWPRTGDAGEKETEVVVVACVVVTKTAFEVLTA